MSALLTWAIGALASMLVIVVHHAVLRQLARRVVPRLHRARPLGVAAVVMALFAAHVIESQLFGAVLWVSAERLALGALAGDVSGSFVDYLYLSLVSYTSLGLGDVVPTGHLRLLVGLEALLGLLMIGWSASFLFARVEALARREAE